jgi:hypothetical protein
LIGGGLALFGAGAAAGKSGPFKGFTDSLAALKPAVKNAAEKFLPNLGALITGDRPLADYLPNGAAVNDAAERLYVSTKAGAEAIAQGRARWLGNLLTSPVTWIVAAVGLFFLLRRR